ncbi:Aquaporin NIP1-1 [Linum perenne]
MGHNHRHQIPLSSGGCSPKASIVTEPQSSIEEGKAASINNQAAVSQVTSFTVDDLSFASTTIHAHKIIAELVGSYVIILVGCASIMVKNKKGQISTVEVAAAWGLAVMVMIYTLGHISGAHFNPAITLALASSCRFPWKQVAGSTLAVLTLRVMFSNQDVDIKGTVATRLQGSLSTLQGFLWEFIISFILMLAVCGVAVDTRAINELSGITIGAAVLFNVLIAG